MSSQDFAWEGLFRALQASGMTYISGLIVVAVIFFLARWFIRRNAGDSTQQAHYWLNRGTVVVVLVMTLSLSWYVVSFVTANRLPRADIDRTRVYDQMNSHLTKRQ